MNLRSPAEEIFLTILGFAIFAMIVLAIICVNPKNRKDLKKLLLKVFCVRDNTNNDGEANNNDYASYRNTLATSASAETLDSWEIARSFVSIDYAKKLGKGAFGDVYIGALDIAGLPGNPTRSANQSGEIIARNGTVAVKMLHDSADDAEFLEFRREIDIMKGIGYHEQLVNLIACITASSPNILIVDYCSKGDLLNFMRERREYMLTLPMNVDYHDVDQSLIITQEQQIHYAIEVAQGMEYLSSRGYIHRDIAARNVLIDDSNHCKIGDFGLCRKVEDENAIYHARGGRFPIKWMAPEALRNYETSTASDIWSFGILLFEIITLGGSPYHEWKPAEVLARLEEGERMQRPDNCPDTIFELMAECWLDKPEDRPTFSKLVLRLEGALTEIPKEYYPQIDADKNYYLVPRSREFRDSSEPTQ